MVETNITRTKGGQVHSNPNLIRFHQSRPPAHMSLQMRAQVSCSRSVHGVDGWMKPLITTAHPPESVGQGGRFSEAEEITSCSELRQSPLAMFLFI